MARALERFEDRGHRVERDGLAHQQARRNGTTRQRVQRRLVFAAGKEGAGHEPDFLGQHRKGIEGIGLRAQAQEQDRPTRAHLFDRLRNQPGPSHALEDDVGLAAKRGIASPHRILRIDDEAARAQPHGARFLIRHHVLQDHGPRAKAARPESDGKADRARAQDQHPVSGSDTTEHYAMQRNRKRLDDRPVGERDIGRERHALVGPGHGIFAIAPALETELAAPGDLAPAARLALAAAAQRHDRDEVPDPKACHLPAQANHFACELVPQDIPELAAVGRVLGHVQVRPADPAARDLHHDLTCIRRGIGYRLYGQRFVQALEYGSLDGVSP